jgi:hypothetical protein
MRGWWIAALFLSRVALADVVQLEPSKDNSLIESSTGALSNGGEVFFFVGRTNQSSESIRRGLLAFDLESIPAGSTITSATLTLYMSLTRAGPQMVALHRAHAGWGEGTAAGFGAGGPAEPGDATWLHTFYDTAFWSSPGGDFATVSSASALVDRLGFYTWGPSAGLVADVQSWVDAPGTNYGWVVLGNETTSTTTKAFDSREGDRKPLLTVEYEPACVPDPVGPGYWNRQCLSASGTIPADPLEADFESVVACADARLAQLGLDASACDAIDMDRPSRCADKSLRALATLVLEVCSNHLQTSCPCGAGNVGAFLEDLATAIREGHCPKERSCVP